MISWRHLDPAKIERAVKLLVRELHPGAQGIDGAGGDKGRDIRLNTPSGLVIFEIKSFAERLSRSQRKQVEESLSNAAKHQPKQWILILPLEPSPSEEEWFDGLRKAYSRIILEWRGIDWLDGQFAAHEDLRRYVEGSDYVLLQRAKELGFEQAVLHNGLADAAIRAQGLHRRTQELSPFWNIDIATHRGQPTFIFSEKFPGAAAQDPVALKAIFAFDQHDPESRALKEQVVHALDYGGGFSVDSRHIKEFEVEASEDTRRLFGGDEPLPHSIQFIPISLEGPPLHLVLEALDPSGHLRESLRVKIKERDRGRRGIRLAASDDSEMLTFVCTMDFPGEGNRRGNLHFETKELTGYLPYVVRPVANFILALTAGGKISIRFGHAKLAETEVPEGYLAEFMPAARLITALDELQRIFRQQFAIPGELTMRDVHLLEMTHRLMIDGKAEWITRSLSGMLPIEGVRNVLSRKDIADAGTIVVESERQRFEFGGHTFELGSTRLWGPRVRLVNLRELEEAARAGAGARPRWECIGDEPIYIQRLK